jgi:dihydroorotase
MSRLVATLFIILMVGVESFGQQIDLLIKNGHVIDPKNNIDGMMDIAIAQGKVLEVRRGISDKNASKVIDASGLYVTPGLIDIHTHVFTGGGAGFADGTNSVAPDHFALRAGVTTVVDAGTSGWRNFPTFKEQVIDRSRTRVLAFLSIGGLGLSGKAAQEDLDDMNVDSTVAMVKRYPETVVGVKIGHYEHRDWTPFDRALEAARRTDVPLFVECHLPQYTLEDQLSRMRPGDIITHSYEKVSERMSVVDDKGKVRDFVLEARKRGVLFDLGHGGAGFWFSEAMPALRQGLAPDSFGTDMHRFSVNAGMKDLSNVMSKYIAMGMSLNDVILRATWSPARSIKRTDLGHLSPGAVADITVFNLRKGKFGFVDAGGNKISGSKKIEVEVTIREGRVVWDLNGLTAKPFVSDKN